MANAMIGKLNFFVRNEALLAGQIAQRRAELWAQMQVAAADFAEALA